MKRLILTVSILLGLGNESTFGQWGPGWLQATNPPQITALEPASPWFTAASSSGPVSFMNEPVIAEEITEQIVSLARNLENDPKRIYDYVHNYIKYVHYFGSKKGAFLTLLEGSGNDFDQCALLVALLRAAAQNSGASYSVSYQFGVMKMPYQLPNNADLKHWLGLTLDATGTPENYFDVINRLNTMNFRRGFPRYELASGFFGFWLLIPQNDANHFIFHRVCVKLIDGANTYYLDPAFKISTPIPGINVAAAMQLNATALLSEAGAGATVNANYVQNLNWNNLNSRLSAYVGNLLTDLKDNHPNLSVEQVISGYEIQGSETAQFSNLPFQFLNEPFSTYEGNQKHIPVQEWNNIPAAYMSGIRLQLGTLDLQLKFPWLRARKLYMRFTSWQANTVQARIDVDDTDEQWVHDLGFATSGTMITSVTHPFGVWNYPGNNIDTTEKRFDQTDGGLVYQAGGWNAPTRPVYVIAYGFDDPNERLTHRQKKLDSFLRSGLSAVDRRVVSETLNVMGLAWIQQTYLGDIAIGAQNATLTYYHHRVGRIAQETESKLGYYVDLPMNYYAHIWKAQSPFVQGNPESKFFEASVLMGSAMEHGIIEQFQINTAASTVKTLYLANQSGQKLILGTPVNASTVSTLLSGESINPYSASERDALLAVIQQNGSTALLPSGKSLLGAWNGYGYALRKVNEDYTVNFSMIINGGYPLNGGFAGNQEQIDPVAANSLFITAPELQNAVPIGLRLVTGADPVNMLTGSFLLNSVDLSVGQPAVDPIV